jgi:PAS domain S-box-containing protein
LGIVAMVAILPEAISKTYYVGLILVLIFNYTIIRLRFIWASLTGSIMLLAYFAVAVGMKSHSSGVLVNNGMFLLASNVACMVASYMIEYWARRDFYSRQLLQIERERVAQANAQLETRVEERTAALTQANVDLQAEMAARRVAAEALKAIALIGAEREVIEWNPAMVRLSGIDKPDALGRRFVDLIPPLIDNPVEREVVMDIAAAKEIDVIPRLEVSISTPDNHSRTLSIHAFPIEAAGGEMMGFLAQDITERLRQERELRQQERLAAVGQLAAGIAHDFNNIMAVIVLHAQMILASGADLSERAREQLTTVIEQAHHASQLIEQILDFSRRAMIERGPLDLLPFLKEQVKLLQRTLPDNIHIVLDWHQERDSYTVEADPTRMQQMVMNLAVNARDAMPAGGTLSLTLTPAPPGAETLPELIRDAPHDWIQLEVSDTGEGIPPEIESRIFEPFFTTKAPNQGTGLGLAQVYGIVKQHQGEIDVDSVVGEGTRFTITLPVCSNHADQAETQATVAIEPGHGETILVVEDNQATRRTLAESLELLGYTICLAENGWDALSKLESCDGDIALVITDLVMPEMDGRTLIATLRTKAPSLPVVVISGHPLDEALTDLQELGVTEWLQKPLDLTELGELVGRLLRG